MLRFPPPGDRPGNVEKKKISSLVKKINIAFSWFQMFPILVRSIVISESGI